MVDIGDSGRESDESVFSACEIGKAVTNNSRNLPASRKLPGSDIESPYVVVGNEAFPLKCNLVKPYARTLLDGAKRICNYRISGARSVFENTFGIMASRFRVFRRPIASKPENVIKKTKAAVALHNYLIQDNGYCPVGYTDASNGQWRQEIDSYLGLVDIERTSSNNYGGDAKTVRDNFCKYFNSSSGAVP